MGINRSLLLSMLFASAAYAQNLRVVPVPWAATDLTIPHAAYNGHATTFKAIARGGNGTYLYEWDFDGDGLYDFSASTTNRYNLSTRFTYPNQAVTTTFLAKVRVTSNGQTVTANYPVRIFADVPFNPATATDRQLQIMRNVAVDDGLWFLHNNLSRSGNEADALFGAQATATISSGQAGVISSDAFLEALGRTGHYPAFPAAYLGTLPDPAGNTQRFRDDPYAEDAMRLVNAALASMLVVAVTAADEANTTGFYPELTATPIAGTDDGIGLMRTFFTGDQMIGANAYALRAFSVSRLDGFVAQVGDSNRVLGRSFEFIIQQMVDSLVWAQNESGVVGSWYYYPNTPNDMLGEYPGGALDTIEALWTAEQWMRSRGIIVPNLVKARLAQYIQANVNTCPSGGTGGTWATAANGVCDFALTAAHTFTWGWLGANLYSTSDSRLAFPSYNGITFGQERSLHDSTLTFITNVFTSTSSGQNNWDIGFVEAGNFARLDGRGNHWSMLHWARAARAVEPEIVNFGANNWARLFSQYLINNQANTGGWNWVFGATQSNSDNFAGPTGQAGWALLTLIPDSPAPVPIGYSSVVTAPEGTDINFFGLSTSGGGTFVWAFGNGATAPGPNVAYAYPDNGNFNATLTETSGSQVGVDTVAVVITNVAPVANAGLDRSVNEGTSLPMAGTFTDPGTYDTWTYAWNFGDSTTANAQIINHTWSDNGVFNVTFRVTDDDGATSLDVATITVNNVAPTLTSTAPTTATDGAAYTYMLTFTDPGTADTHTCSKTVGPVGSQMLGCVLTWTASAQSAAPVPFTVCVTDDDGGQTCQSFNVTVSFVDADMDQLPDSWETTFFTTLTAQDQLGDPDNDGMNNLQELVNSTNPTVYDGPSSPSMQLPTCGSKVTDPRPTLTVTNATDPQVTALTYDFELYEDMGLTRLAERSLGVAAGMGTTSWRVSAPLTEDAHYFWRARAHDPFVAGAWTMPVCEFTVDAVNQLPNAPRVSMPAVGARVNSLTPTLTVDNAVDPEGDALTYEFEVTRGTMVVASMTMVASGTGSTSWTVSTALSEDTEYTWRARAVSASGFGPYSALGRFFVSMANTPPPAPVIVSPQNGTVVDSLTPELVFLAVTDPDGDTVVYDWELGADETFGTVIAFGMDISATRVTGPPGVTEDMRVCWRVRSDDGMSTSAWVRACFTATATEGGPGVPTTLNPSDGSEVATLVPVFSWAVSVDPEGDAVSYELEVKQGDSVVGTAAVAGTTAVLAAPLEDGKAYTWRVQAVTARGPASDYSASSSFTVKLPVPMTTTPSKCGCASSPAGLLLGAAMLLLRRRRR